CGFARRSRWPPPNRGGRPPMGSFLLQGARDAALLSRRGFLIGAAGTGFAFGFGAAGLAAADVAAGQGAFEPTIWYRIDRDGIVTVNIIRAEMGQHIGTSL